MKRLIAILLAALTLVLLLSSCSGKKEQPTATQEPETMQASPRPTTSKHITVGIEPKDEGWSFWTEY